MKVYKLIAAFTFFACLKGMNTKNQPPFLDNINSDNIHDKLQLVINYYEEHSKCHNDLTKNCSVCSPLKTNVHTQLEKFTAQTTIKHSSILWFTLWSANKGWLD